MINITYGQGVQAFGDSFTVGNNATSNVGFAPRFRGIVGGPFYNFGVGHMGAQTAARNGYENHAIGARTIANTWMAGLNDIRGTGVAAFAEIEQGLTAFLASAFLGSYKPASLMTKIGTWTALSNAYGGKAFSLGGTPLYTNSNMSASLSWTFTGDNVVIGSYATNGTTGYYQDLDIEIDGVHSPFNILGKTDIQAGVAAKLITGLGAGSHTITIHPTTTAAHTVVDFVGTVTPDNKAPVLVSHIPYVADWAAYGSVATKEIADAANILIGEVVSRFQAIGCLVELVEVNEFYDPSGSSDGIHPPDRGHSQITMAFLDRVILQ
ncbi:hypothetical protein G9X67_34560 [Rhizobium sp. WYCCWR 11152]|uniref:hypothetical protein n=1 Tax=Rhizobium sp. WYCCWR 11152 TaxID=2692316 RepID=UPI0014914954|nr:hypothetical protein [Rhizobium sp. WYCCWR 11152]NNU70380.1 hypothetical protein [Rhizobium sp. WYCCWR 11152]